MLIVAGIGLAAAGALFSIEAMGFAVIALILAILCRVMMLLDGIAQRAD